MWTGESETMKSPSAKWFVATVPPGRIKETNLQGNSHLVGSTHVKEDSSHQENGQGSESGDGNFSPLLESDDLGQSAASGRETSNLVKTTEDSRILLLASDVQKLEQYLSSEMEKICTKLAKYPSCKDYYQLSVLTAAKIVLFNKPRASRVMLLTVVSFNNKYVKLEAADESLQSLSSVERKLCERLDVMKALDKDGNEVLILLTPLIKEAVDLLIEKRPQVKIRADDPYIFSMTGGRMTSSTRVLYTVSKNVKLENPRLLHEARLEKHVALLSQIIAMQNEKLDRTRYEMANLAAMEDLCSLCISSTEIKKVLRLLLGTDCVGAEHNAEETTTRQFESLEAVFSKPETSTLSSQTNVTPAVPKHLKKNETSIRKLTVKLCDISKYLVKAGQDVENITEGFRVDIKSIPHITQQGLPRDKSYVSKSRASKCRQKGCTKDISSVKRSARKCRQEDCTKDISSVRRSTSKNRHKVCTKDNVSVKRLVNKGRKQVLSEDNPAVIRPASNCQQKSCTANNPKILKRLAPKPNTCDGSSMKRNTTHQFPLPSKLIPSPADEKYVYKVPETLPSWAVMINGSDSWMLGSVIGRGGFGKMYDGIRATFKSNGVSSSSRQPFQNHLIRVEAAQNGVIFHEIYLYKAATKTENVDNWKREHDLTHLAIPKFVAFGQYLYNKVIYNFMVSEAIGKSLQCILRRENSRLEPRLAYSIAHQIVDAVEYLHSLGFVHADIKPATIMMCHGASREEANRVVLVDFGISTAVFQLGQSKEISRLMLEARECCLEYASRDEHNKFVPTKRGDIETLAYNLVHWLSGKLPWEGVQNEKEVWWLKTIHLSEIQCFLSSCFGGSEFAPQLYQFLKYVSGLNYKKTPDYSHVRSLLKEAKEMYPPQGGSNILREKRNRRKKKKKKKRSKKKKERMRGEESQREKKREVFGLKPSRDSLLGRRSSYTNGSLNPPLYSVKLDKPWTMLTTLASQSVPAHTRPSIQLIVVSPGSKQPANRMVTPTGHADTAMSSLSVHSKGTIAKKSFKRKSNSSDSLSFTKYMRTKEISRALVSPLQKSAESVPRKNILLTQGNTQLTQGNTQLTQGNTQLTQGNTQFTQGSTQFTQGNTQFTQGNTQIEEQSVDGGDLSPLLAKEDGNGSIDSNLSNNKQSTIESTCGILNNTDSTNATADGHLSSNCNTNVKTEIADSTQIADVTVKIKSEPIDPEYSEKELNYYKTTTQETWRVMVGDAVCCDNVKPDPDGDDVSAREVIVSENSPERCTSMETDGICYDNLKPDPDGNHVSSELIVSENSQERGTSMETDAVCCDDVKPDPDGINVSAGEVIVSENSQERCTFIETDAIPSEGWKAEPEDEKSQDFSGRDASQNEDNQRGSLTLVTADKEPSESISSNQNMNCNPSGENGTAIRSGPEEWKIVIKIATQKPVTPAAYHVCMYCGALRSEIISHLISRHKTEKQVHEALSSNHEMVKGAMLKELKFYGDHCHNIRVLKNKKGTLIVLEVDQCTMTTQDISCAEDYLPCPECLGYVFYADFLSHRRHCDAYHALLTSFRESSHVESRNAQALKSKAVASFIRICIYGSKAMRNIFIFMLSDSLKLRRDFENMESHRDSMLRAVCTARTYKKRKNDQSNDMWQLFEVMRLGDTHDSAPFAPETVNAIFTLIQFLYQQSKPLHLYVNDQGDLHSHQWEVQHLAMVIRDTLTSCAVKLKRRASAARDRDILSRMDEIISLFDIMASVDRSHTATNSNCEPLNIHRVNNPLANKSNAIEMRHIQNDIIISDLSILRTLTSYVQALEKYLNAEIEKHAKFGNHLDRSGYLGLSLATAVKIILLNKPRAEEAMQLTVQSYAKSYTNFDPDDDILTCLTSIEKKLSERLPLVKVSGQNGKMVPIFLTPKIKKAVELLLVKRRVVNIHPQNPFVFAKWEGLMDSMNASSVLCSFAMNLDKKMGDWKWMEADCLQDEKLHNYIATISQIMAMDNHELEWLQSHHAYSLAGDNNVQKVQCSSWEMAKVVRWLFDSESEQIQASDPDSDTCDDLTKDPCSDPGKDSGCNPDNGPGNDADSDLCNDPDNDPCNDPGKDSGYNPDNGPANDTGSDPCNDSGCIQGKDLANSSGNSDPGKDSVYNPENGPGTDEDSDLCNDSGNDQCNDPCNDPSKDSGYNRDSGPGNDTGSDSCNDSGCNQGKDQTNGSGSSDSGNDPGRVPGNCLGQQVEEASEISISVKGTNFMEDSLEEQPEEKYSDILSRTGVEKVKTEKDAASRFKTGFS